MHPRSAPRALALAARWFPVAAALLGTSCGSGLNPVEGKVLVNGQPAQGAIVAFHSKGEEKLTTRTPTGIAGADGTFTLSTLRPGDGAAAGEYTVTIVWPEEPKTGGKPILSTEPPPDPADRLNGRYADRAKGLPATVKSGRNQLPPFDLK